MGWDRNTLVEDLTKEIYKTQIQIFRSTNSQLIIFFWEIGNILNNQNKKKLASLSSLLKVQYGSFFNARNIKKMSEFAIQF